MARETGKALKDAIGEVRRSKDTLTLSAEEAIRIEGEHIPLEASEMGAGKLAVMLRHPVGVVGAITPFNAPFNLAAHKIAPALAAGNSIVLKAPPQSPLVVHRLVRLFHDAGVPAGFVNLVYGGAKEGEALVRDPRVDFITFTGSSRVGEAINRHAGLRRVALELGGNGPTIVHEDADLAVAAPTCARNAVRLAGQSCISVQNVYVHRSKFQAMVDGMAAAMRALVVGDPLDPATDVGTLIDEPSAQRVEAWVAEARAGGAKVVVGGERRGAQFPPTLLTGVDRSMKVVCDEVFGPVANVIPYDRIEEAIEAVNASPYGLQCGLYTRSNELTFRLIREIRTGGLIVNGTSTWRTDQLAYGGVKASGFGREGPRYAIRDMTEQRVVVFNF
jgi:acyl-CoA reductase-like NAD-dependent aldehyde dehydrogenase